MRLPDPARSLISWSEMQPVSMRFTDDVIGNTDLKAPHQAGRCGQSTQQEVQPVIRFRRRYLENLGAHDLFRDERIVVYPLLQRAQ